MLTVRFAPHKPWFTLTLRLMTFLLVQLELWLSISERYRDILNCPGCGPLYPLLRISRIVKQHSQRSYAFPPHSFGGPHMPENFMTCLSRKLRALCVCRRIACVTRARPQKSRIEGHRLRCRERVGFPRTINPPDATAAANADGGQGWCARTVNKIVARL